MSSQGRRKGRNLHVYAHELGLNQCQSKIFQSFRCLSEEFIEFQIFRPRPIKTYKASCILMSEVKQIYHEYKSCLQFLKILEKFIKIKLFQFY